MSLIRTLEELEAMAAPYRVVLAELERLAVPLRAELALRAQLAARQQHLQDWAEMIEAFRCLGEV